nr:immunoglobulin heavy chain junction region [Mus musculus]MBK4188824.1 immunoglobulin heavy chain junction region [Mus musculus]MBK4188825.1 immunoglobulin heavy chain junction region [Mus musculus]
CARGYYGSSFFVYW